MKWLHRIGSLLICVSLLLSVCLGLFSPAAASPVTENESLAEEDFVEIRGFEIVEAPVRAPDIVTGKVFVPTYDGGTSSGWMDYDCGVGVSYKNSKNQSKLRIVTNTTSSGFTAWCTKLADNGFTCIWHRSCAAQTNTNRYAKYLSEDGTYAIYTYFVPATKMTRIIVDTYVDTLGTFSYAGSGTAETEFYMYYLSGMNDGWSAASPETAGTQFRGNAGSMFIVKMRDNSLFIIDGGGANQMGDRSCEELYAFLRSITGTEEGTKMVINTWFISHNHTDHCGGFPRFLHKYSTQFDLKNIMYNFDFEGSSRGFIHRVARMYPEAKYYKPHTGESFKVAGVQFDILYTVEDRYKPNNSNQLLLNDASCTNHIQENNQSIVMRMTFDGKEAILTGDIRDADVILLSMYPAADLKADILQIPHHNFDEHTELAKTVSPSVAFINSPKSASFNRSRMYANRAGWKPYVGSYYFGGTETVGYSASKGVFYRKSSDGYDFLQWGNAAYYIREENPVSVTNSVTDPEVYYRYTKTTEITDAYQTYLIADEKLKAVLSYDAIGGTVSNAMTGLYDGKNFHFSASQRRFVNWNIRYGATGSNSLSPNSTATDFYTSCKVIRGSGDYWGTPTKNYNLTLGYNDTFTSTGFFGSRSPFSAQMESSSTGISIDGFGDGTFVIYRQNSGTYYPLFRDGDAVGEGGWGTAALSKSTAGNRAVVLLTNLYAYEKTASNMRVSWSGHKDYYTYTGASKESMDTLLAADLRITYAFDNFAGGGEMGHTFGGNNNPNAYYLEYSPAYESSKAQDYTVTIKYTGANGTAVTVGSFNLHVSSRPDRYKLYFDFSDDTAAREKYKYQSQYAEINFDGTSRWEATRSGSEPVVTVYNDSGVAKITVSDWDATTGKGTYLSPYAGGTAPLKYTSSGAQVLQVRFRMNNMRAATDSNPFIRLWYTKTVDGEAVTTYDKAYKLGVNYVSDGKYITATIDLYTQAEIDAGAGTSGFPTTTFAKAGTISDIRIGFHNFVADAEDRAGEIIVDYIYIGPKAEMPNGVYTATFCQEDGTVLQTNRVYEGEAAVYQGTTPIKAADDLYHYDFAGWKTKAGAEAALSSVTSNLTVYASFTAIAHSYAYETHGAEIHTAACACGYSITEAHNYVNGTCACGEKEIKEPMEDASLKLNHSLNLASDISVNLVISKSALVGFDMGTVYVESVPENGKTVRISPVENGNYYYFTVTGLTALNMNDRIRSVLYGTKNGQPYYSPVDDYAIADYAYALLNTANGDRALKTLCADLLRYGAKAQIYKNYRVDHLADSKMTEEHKAYLSDMEAITFGNVNQILTDVANAPIAWAGKTLNLESKVALKFVFNPVSYTGEISDLTLRVSYKDIDGNAKNITVETAELYSASLGYYVFTVDTLLAAELRAPLSVQIYAGDTPVSCTMQFSADTYGNGQKGDLLTLCKALIAYSDSAKAYFTK